MRTTADQRPTVLITGFGPFPGVEENASARLVRDLVRRGRRALPRYHFTAAILPTMWRQAPAVIQILYARHQPILSLHFGVAGAARGFRIETTGKNHCRSSRDAAGLLPLSPQLIAGGLEHRAVTIAADRIAARLRAEGFPVSLSQDAGGYLCNAVLYHSLSLAEANHRGRCLVGFVHIPADLTPATLTLPRAVAGALEILKIALEPRAGVAALTRD